MNIKRSRVHQPDCPAWERESILTPELFLRIKKLHEKKIAEHEQIIFEAHESAAMCPLPKKLRPAEPRDVVEGAIMWNPNWDGKKWDMIEEVLDPSSEFKAWEGMLGRQGLDGAFIEINLSIK